MRSDVITAIDQVSAVWLTSILTQSGAITNGAVKSFEFATGQGN
jgi:hypothetical protein